MSALGPKSEDEVGGTVDAVYDGASEPVLHDAAAQPAFNAAATKTDGLGCHAG